MYVCILPPVGSRLTVSKALETLEVAVIAQAQNVVLVFAS